MQTSDIGVYINVFAARPVYGGSRLTAPPRFPSAVSMNRGGL